jgi:hypothetical protein
MRPAGCFVAAFLAAMIALQARAAPQEKPGSTSAQAPAPAEALPAPSPGIVEGMLAQSPSESGYMDAKQVNALLDQVRFAEYRINDLMTDVHPERWKISPAARNSFNQTVAAMRTQLLALKEWRSQFAARPDGSYAGFETYATIGAILPRLEGVARTISEADNASYGAQFYASADKLFDLQQKLGPYVGFLLSNQDSIAQALENNLAGCQKDLGRAMRGQSERPKLIQNSAPVRARGTRARPASISPRKREEHGKNGGAAKPPAKNP